MKQAAGEKEKKKGRKEEKGTPQCLNPSGSSAFAESAA